MKKLFTTRALVQSAIIAALYAALTVINPWGYGSVQVRVSEALCVLSMFAPSSVFGLFVGCLLANIIGGFGIIDIICGSIATGAAAYFTYKFRNNFALAMFFPVIFNAVIVGGYLYILYDKTYPMLATMGFVGLGQLIACYGIGGMLYVALKNRSGFLQ